jgi:hypothetical protein
VTTRDFVDSLPVDGWILETNGAIRFHDSSGVPWCPLQRWTNKRIGYVHAARERGIDWAARGDIMAAVDAFGDTREAKRLRGYMMKRWKPKRRIR